jgi:hypothetical protein
MRNEAMRHAQVLLAEFGLSPAARSKVSATTPDPFAGEDPAGDDIPGVAVRLVHERVRHRSSQVVAGRILACKWIRLACQRHLDDLARQDEPGFPYKPGSSWRARSSRWRWQAKRIHLQARIRPATTSRALACQRHLDDLARQDEPGFPYRFEPGKAEKVCRLPCAPTCPWCGAGAARTGTPSRPSPARTGRGSPAPRCPSAGCARPMA